MKLSTRVLKLEYLYFDLFSIRNNFMTNDLPFYLL